MRYTFISCFTGFAILLQSVVAGSSEGQSTSVDVGSWSVEISAFQRDCSAMYLDIAFPTNFDGAMSQAGSVAIISKQSGTEDPDPQSYQKFGSTNNASMKRFTLAASAITKFTASLDDSAIISFRIGDNMTSPLIWSAQSARSFTAGGWRKALKDEAEGGGKTTCDLQIS
ncbi:hypothetical protein T439DRAFT_355768 [Meredithblackwellia eburnea MCA 4105]